MLNPKEREVSSLNGKLVTHAQRVCYSQRYEESFFNLESLPNTHEGEKLMKLKKHESNSFSS